MKRAIHLLAALALVCAVPASAAFVKSANATGVLPGGPEGAVLYDQTDSASGNGAPDQDFEAAFNAYDSFAADDFVVTDATGWDIAGVNTVGTTGAAGGATVSVVFYTNSPGGGDPDLPGVSECSYAGIVPGDAAGSLTITLPSTCSLPIGTHWVEIQVAQSFGANGQHFWSNRSVQTGSEGVWRNPANGFGTGCTTYAPQTSCGVGGGASPDFLFQIEGTVGVASSSILAIPTLSTLGLVGLGLLMLVGGFFALRRRNA